MTGMFDFTSPPRMTPLFLDPELGTVVSTPPARRTE
jgi:hypothetical protein